MLNPTTELAPDGQPWNLLTLRNDAGMTVTVMDWGATLLSARVTLADGSVREALLGCANPGDYTRQAAYLGASVGRYANRIANSRFTLDGRTVNLTPSNEAGHQLHGGPEGFDKRRWQIVSADDRHALFSLSSRDGDHVYFNLDGVQSDVRSHKLQIFADAYLPVESDGIPGGDLQNVTLTSFDFRTPKVLADDFLRDEDQQKVKGYDHAFLLQALGDAKSPAAHVWSQDEKLQMTVYTSAPALQFYSGNYLAGTPSRTAQPYDDWQGLALESEFLPDSPNHPEWPQPDCVLRPGEEYVSLTEYQFIAQ